MFCGLTGRFYKSYKSKNEACRIKKNYYFYSYRIYKYIDNPYCYEEAYISYIVIHYFFLFCSMLPRKKRISFNHFFCFLGSRKKKFKF